MFGEGEGMPGTSAILCCRCKKDVSATKRVKDARGQDFCEPCYKVVMNQRAAPAKVGAAKSAVAAPPPPPPVTARPPQRVAAPVAQAAEAAAPAAAKPLPARCPACDAPVMPGRRICLRCNRDVTKLDK